MECGDVVGDVESHGIGMGLGFDDGEGVGEDGVVFGELVGAEGSGRTRTSTDGHGRAPTDTDGDTDEDMDAVGDVDGE